MNEQITTVLNTIDAQRSTENPTWNIDANTGTFLNTLVRAIKATRVLEIGTSTGYSGIWLAEPLTEHNGELVTIESHAERFSIATQNFTDAGLSEIITQIKGHAPEVLDDVEGNFDLMFFDATKMEHIDYFSYCESRLNVGGLIITDNVLSHAQELESYIDFVQKKQNFQSSVIDIGTGLMIGLKLQ